MRLCQSLSLWVDGEIIHQKGVKRNQRNHLVVSRLILTRVSILVFHKLS